MLGSEVVCDGLEIGQDFHGTQLGMESLEYVSAPIGIDNIGGVHQAGVQASIFLNLAQLVSTEDAVDNGHFISRSTAGGQNGGWSAQTQDPRGLPDAFRVQEVRTTVIGEGLRIRRCMPVYDDAARRQTTMIIVVRRQNLVRSILPGA